MRSRTWASETAPVRGVSAVLLDLDGTLTDPGEGILASIRHALEGLGVPVPEHAALRDAVGDAATVLHLDLAVRAREDGAAAGFCPHWKRCLCIRADAWLMLGSEGISWTTHSSSIANRFCSEL